MKFTNIAETNTLSSNLTSRLSVQLFSKNESHENINKVRKLAAALLDEDLEKAQSFYSANATFYDINMPKGESMNLDQAKESQKFFYENFEILSMDEYGYPDFLDYEHRASKVVLAWWDVRVKRKSDGKHLGEKKTLFACVFYVVLLFLYLFSLSLKF